MATPVITNVDNVNHTYMADGQKYALNPTTNRFQLASTLNQPAPASVTSASLKPTSPISVPPTPVDALSSAVTSSNDELTAAKTATGGAEKAYQTSQNDLQVLTKQLEGKTADQQALEQAQGIPQINQNLNELQDISRQKTLEYNTTPYSLQGQGRGITTGILRGQEAVKQRQLGIDIMLNNSNIQAAQGKLQLAQATVDRALAAKYDPILARIDAQKAILDNNKFLLSRADQKEADAKSKALSLQKTQLEKQMADEKEVQNLILEAAPFAPASILTKARDIQSKGGTPTQVAIALGEYGKDFLKNQLLKEQLKTEKAQQSKIYTDIQKTKSEITGPNGTILKPLTEVQAKDLLYAQRGEQASSLIDGLENKIVNMSPTDFATSKLLEKSVLTSSKVSPEIRQLAQAERNFATAVLRKESGAAISASEFATVEKQYFPRPGDDPQTLAQKKQNRETYITSTKSGVPGYSSRVSTPESSYLDSVFKSLEAINSKTDSTSLYTARLLGK